MAKETSHAFHVVWSDPMMQQALLHAFFPRVLQRRETRKDIDEWLRQLGTTPTNPVGAALLRAGVNPSQVRWERITDFLCECYYVQLNDPFGLARTPTDEEWDNDEAAGGRALYPERERIIRRSVPLYLLPLEQRLLACARQHQLGATRMVYRGPERDLEQLLARGQVFLGPVEMQEGKPSQAHENAARLWRQEKQAFSLVTGYGLSEDGLFRQHSWILRTAPHAGQPRIIETTVPRILYYGYVLNEQESEQFCAAELN